jgi:hypothetical protein
MSLTTTRFFTYLSAMICSAGSVETVVAQETINVGLRWVHQFQFAGYYAEKGFHVNLVQGSPNHDVSDEVLAGTLDFWNSELRDSTAASSWRTSRRDCSDLSVLPFCAGFFVIIRYSKPERP